MRYIVYQLNIVTTKYFIIILHKILIKTSRQWQNLKLGWHIQHMSVIFIINAIQLKMQYYLVRSEVY